MGRKRFLVAGTFLILMASALARSASALDHVVGGTQLALRSSGGSGALTLVLRDPAFPIPAPGSADDPSQAGLVITLFGRGSETQAQLVAAPGAGWKVRATPRVTYAHANPTAPPGSIFPNVVSLRDGAGLRVRAKSAGLALDGPEGAIAVLVEMGATRICALFDGDAVRRDQGGRFIARDADASGLANCDDDTLAGRTCEESLACGGSCPGDAVCAGEPSGVIGCQCVSPHQPCGTSDPACNGECPAGEECSNLGGVLNSSCGCLPAGSTSCGGVFPSCGDGDCPVGTSCLVDTFTCCGGLTLEWCACLSGPPPEPCPGGCPDGWSCVGPAPNFPPTCLPPFCNDGAGAPVCSGTCTLAGTACTPIGGVCLCLDPCLGAEPFPTCGGGCTDAGFTCRAVEGQCVCVP